MFSIIASRKQFVNRFLENNSSFFLISQHGYVTPGHGACPDSPSGPNICHGLQPDGATHLKQRPKRTSTSAKPYYIYYRTRHTTRGRRSAQEPPIVSGGPAETPQQAPARTHSAAHLPAVSRSSGRPEAARNAATLDTIHAHRGRHHGPQEAATPAHAGQVDSYSPSRPGRPRRPPQARRTAPATVHQFSRKRPASSARQNSRKKLKLPIDIQENY